MQNLLFRASSIHELAFKSPLIFFPSYASQIKSGRTKKPLFFFNCGIHAREWISPATCMYMIRQILTTRKTNSDVKFMLDNYEWVIVPVLNVDGYEYTHTHVSCRQIRRGGGGGVVSIYRIPFIYPLYTLFFII